MTPIIKYMLSFVSLRCRSKRRRNREDEKLEGEVLSPFLVLPSPPPLPRFSHISLMIAMQGFSFSIRLENWVKLTISCGPLRVEKKPCFFLIQNYFIIRSGRRFTNKIAYNVTRMFYILLGNGEEHELGNGTVLVCVLS